MRVQSKNNILYIIMRTNTFQLGTAYIYTFQDIVCIRYIYWNTVLQVLYYLYLWYIEDQGQVVY